MYLSRISILFFGMILLIITHAMPSSFLYHTDDDQANNDIDDTKTQFNLRRSGDYATWLYRRNSPLCDYRLQFRPLPITSALCGYG